MSNIIIGIAITILVIVPVVILANYGKQKHKNALRRFRKIAAENSLNISDCDSCDLGIIGIDTDMKKLLYVQNGKDVVVVDTNEIKSCTIKTYPEVINGDFIDIIVMDIELKDGRGSRVMQLFSSENKLTMDEEKSIAEKWHRIIESHIAK